MRLKRFITPTMAEAMAEVRAAMGENAIIVSSHNLGRGRGVEVTAAVEPDLSERANVHRPRANSPPPPSPSPSQTAIAEHVARTLAWHGTPAKLNERLCLAAAVMQADDPTIALAGACDATFTFSPLALGPGSRIMLVGTVGAGKTVTCAKLAARAVLAGGNIQLITSDTVRAGAVGQIEAFAKLMGQSLVSVANPAEMTRAVAAADPRIPMVIDSPGTNVYAQGEIDDLRRFIDAAGAQPIVVMAAGADAAEAAEAAEIFASLGANRLVATRIDATRRFGAVLAAAYVGRMAFAELGVSPFIVEGLHDLNPVALARLLLADPALPRQRTAMAQAAQ